MDFSLVRYSLCCCFAATALATTPVVTLNAPTASQVDLSKLPAGKTLIVPITATDSAGLPLTYKVSSNNAKVMVRAKTGNPLLHLTVNYGATQPGELYFMLFREWAPKTAAFISGFAQAGFYDGLKFHRVVKGFVIQGGDPLGTGAGGPGMTGNDASTSFKFDNEFQPGLIFTGRGQLAMANSGYDSNYAGTNGSQFFVTLDNLHLTNSVHQLSLDFKHTIFGQMMYGWDALDAIGNVAVDGNDAPTSDVVITTAKVQPDNHDAILMLSANGVVLGTSTTITVTASDGQGGSATQTFAVGMPVTDAINDPPVILPVAPQVVPEATQLNFRLQYFDLEGDYLFFDHGLLGLGQVYAKSTSSGSVAAVLGNAGFTGQVQLGLDIKQYDMINASTDSPVVQNYGLIGIGDRAIRAVPVDVEGAPTVAINSVFAKFKDLDPAGSAGNFSATINWGDGTAVQAGTIGRDGTVAGIGNYQVSGGHTYARAGIYTIITTVTGNKGALAYVRSPATITSSSVVAVGQEVDVTGPTASNRLVATFSDSNPTGKASDYSTIIDWGDGTSSAGVVAKVTGSNYVVHGTHTYKDAEPFALTVRLHKSGADPATDSYAWSTAYVSGFSPVRHLPPFPLVHLVAAWNSGPTKSITNKISGSFEPSALAVKLVGDFVVINAGSKASAPSTIRFFLSNDQVLASDTQLTVNGVAELQAGSFAAGSGGSGEFTLTLPKGQSGGGKYVIAQLVYSDPIIDGSKVDKIVVSGPINPTVIVFDKASSVGQSGSSYETSESGGTFTCKVVLDTQPTANVTMSLVSSLPSEGTVSPSSLTFTPANWSTAQTVTVTGVADTTKDGNKAYTLTLGVPSSTDTNYSALSTTVINLINVDTTP